MELLLLRAVPLICGAAIDAPCCDVFVRFGSFATERIKADRFVCPLYTQ